jgi:hypothetical protein
MASTPTSTPTTPAMPIAVVRAAALRSGSERRLKKATENIWVRKDTRVRGCRGPAKANRNTFPTITYETISN